MQLGYRLHIFKEIIAVKVTTTLDAIVVRLKPREKFTSYRVCGFS